MSPTPSCPRCFAPIVPSEAPGGLCPKCMIAVAMGEDGMIRSALGSPVPAPPAIDELSPHFPGLEIISLVGRGGSGAVYRAIQRDLGRMIALKVLLLDPANDPAFGERFAREARAMARLNHPNIASVHDAGRAGPYWFLTMEFVDGANLRQVLQQGSMTAADALDFTRQICAALEYAHGMGVVHRDIKPENVLVDEAGAVKLVDFGLAKLVGGTPEAVSLTGKSQAMGTWRYMAPEQLNRPREVDHRADIFSLGVVLYELLTGEIPQGRYAPLSSRAKVDSRLDDVVDRTLQQDPDQRYQEVRGVGEDLDSIGRGEPTPPHAGAAAAPAQNPNAASDPGPRAGLTYRQQRKLQKAELRAQRGCVAQLFSFILWMLLLFFVLALLAGLFFTATSFEPELVSNGEQPSGLEQAREIEQPKIAAQLIHRVAPSEDLTPRLRGNLDRIATEYLVAEEDAATMTRIKTPDQAWLQIDVSAFERTILRLEDEILLVVEEELGASERAAVARRFEAQRPFRFGYKARSFEYFESPDKLLRELGGRERTTTAEIREVLPLHVRRKMTSRILPILRLDADVADRRRGASWTAERLGVEQIYCHDFWNHAQGVSGRARFEDGDWKHAFSWEPDKEFATAVFGSGMVFNLGNPEEWPGGGLHDYPGPPFVVDGQIGRAFRVFVDASGRGVVVPGLKDRRIPDLSEAAELAPVLLRWIETSFPDWRDDFKK